MNSKAESADRQTDRKADTHLRRVDAHGVLELVLEAPGLRAQPVGVPLAGRDEARPVVLHDAREADLPRLQVLTAVREPPSENPLIKFGKILK